MSLLGLDVGTTGTKAVAFDITGNIISSSYREYPLIHPKPGWIELDSNVVWNAIKEVLTEVASKTKSDPISALAVSSLGEAATPINKNGEVIYNSIVGFDTRTEDLVLFWERVIGKEKILKITGMPLSGIYTINKIMWMKKHMPDVYKKVWKFLCYEDFVIYKLTGVPVIDYSLASRTMAFDIKKKKWSKEILEKAQVPKNLFSEVAQSGEIVENINKKVASEIGLPDNVKVVTGGHDQPCGALGAGVIKSGLVMDATGTVECLAPAFNKPVLNRSMLKHNHCCYLHVVENLYINISFNFTGGSLLKWYRDTLCKSEIETAKQKNVDVYDIMLTNIKEKPTDLFILPHFTTTGTPWFDANSKGCILGLTLATSKDEITKAVLEGITYEMKLNLELLEESGIKINEIRAIGGGAKSRKWLQLKADMFGKKVVSMKVSEAVCLGAAILAGKATGEYTSIENAVNKVVKQEEIFYPDKNRQKEYEEKFRKIYKNLYLTMKDLNHEISIGVRSCRKT